MFFSLLYIELPENWVNCSALTDTNFYVYWKGARVRIGRQYTAQEFFLNVVFSSDIVL